MSTFIYSYDIIIKSLIFTTFEKKGSANLMWEGISNFVMYSGLFSTVFYVLCSSACLSLTPTHPHLLFSYSILIPFSSSSQHGPSPGGVARGHVSAP